MPAATHVLMDRFGRIVEEILEIDHAGHDALVILRHKPGTYLAQLSELTIVSVPGLMTEVA